MSTTNNKEITIYDIANQLGISASSVSRALQDHPLISKKTKAKVNALAKELGYRQNNFARNIRSQQTFTLGVIIPKLDSPFMSSVLAGMENIASRNKYNLIIGQSLESYQQEIKRVDMMFNSRIDGLLVSVSSQTLNTDHFESFFQKELPVVFFDRLPQNLTASSVTIDNFKAAFKATEHLIQQGCKKIVHITTNSQVNVYHERLEGYRQALETHGLAFKEENVIFGDLSQMFGVMAANIICSMPVIPDGIFVANDFCAVSCLSTLKKAGFNIPHDIAIVGFNDDPISTVIDPPLTSVRYSGYHLGEMATQRLINLIQGIRSTGTSNHIKLESSLVIRSSSMRTH